VASAGVTVGTPRQKVCWPIPYRCLVPSAGLEPLVWFLLTVTVTAMTEPRGAAPKGSGLSTRYNRHDRIRKIGRAQGARS
jgi:hypothetical protein